MGEFLEREQGNHTEMAVVRPDTPPTHGDSGSEERPTTLVTLETSVGGLGTPPTPGDTSAEARPATPPTPGTPVVKYRHFKLQITTCAENGKISTVYVHSERVGSSVFHFFQ